RKVSATAGRAKVCAWPRAASPSHRRRQPVRLFLTSTRSPVERSTCVTTRPDTLKHKLQLMKCYVSTGHGPREGRSAPKGRHDGDWSVDPGVLSPADPAPRNPESPAARE